MTPLDHEPHVPDALKQRVIRSLRSRGVLRAPTSARRVAQVARIAAAVVVFAAGVAAGRATSGVRGGATSNEPLFLLALHEDERFQPGRTLPELVQEYGAWAAALGERGRLVVAEQLDGSVTVLPAEAVGGAAAPEGATPARGGGAPGLVAGDAGGSAVAPGIGGIGEMTGFFLIRAQSSEDALATALTHPHLRYGGRIVLRGVVR
jgi:hypothetical protein